MKNSLSLAQLIGVTMESSARRRRVDEREEEQKARLERMDENAANEPPLTLSSREVIVSPDGLWFLQHFKSDQEAPCVGRTRKAFVLNKATSFSAIVDTRLKDITCAEWSPNNQQVAFGGSSYVYVFTSKDRRTAKFRVNGGSVCYIGWIDANTFRVGTTGGCIYEVQLSNDSRGEVELVRTFDGVPKKALCVVAGNCAIACAYQHTKETLAIKLFTPHETSLFMADEASVITSMVLSKTGNRIVATSPEGIFLFKRGEKDDESNILMDDVLDCHLCAIAPDGIRYAFANEKILCGAMNDSIIFSRRINSGLRVAKMYFTDRQTLVVVFQADGREPEVVRFVC